MMIRDEMMMRTSNCDEREMGEHKVCGWGFVVVGQGIKEGG